MVDHARASAPVVAASEIDVSTAATLRQHLYDAIDGDVGGVIVVDLSAVEFIDSTGLGVLVAGLKRAKSSGGTVAVTGAQPSILRLFEITGLDQVFAAPAAR